MDLDFLSTLYDEIALEGLDGITLPTLWLRLESCKAFSLQIDEHSKNFIWDCITKNLELEFYELPKTRPPLVLFSRYDHVDLDLGIVIEPSTLPDEIYPYAPVNRPDVRGSCKTFDERCNISSNVRSEPHLPLKEVLEKWGDKLVIVASQNLRNLSLMGDQVPQNFELGLVQYCILEKIGRARFHGEVTQGKLSLASLNVPPKSLFYYRKLMLQKKLITKQLHFQRTPQSQMIRCSLLHLTRFFVERKSKMELMMINMCNYLSKMPNQRESFQKLRSELGMKENSFKKIFVKFIQPSIRVRLMPYSEMYPNEEKKLHNNGSEKNIKVVELLKASYDQDSENEDEDITPHSEDLFFDPRKFVYDRPLLVQAFDVVASGGSEGITAQDLGKHLGLPKLEVRLLCRNLERRGVIAAFMQDMGRQRVNKYVAKHFEETSGLHKKFLEARQKIFEITNATRNEDAEVGTSSEAVLDTGTLNEEQRSALQNDAKHISVVSEVIVEKESAEVDRKPMWPFSLDELKKASPSLIKKNNITYRMLKRAHMIMETVQKARLVDEPYKIHKIIVQEEKKEGLQEMICRKSFARIIHRLLKDGYVKSVRTVLRLGNQVKKLHFICDPSLKSDDPLIKSAIEQAKFKAFCHNKEEFKFYSQLSPSKPQSYAESVKALRDITKGTEPDVKLEYLPSIGRTYGLEPKFVRMKSLFQFLFYLVNDYSGKEIEADKNGFMRYHPELSWKTFVPPLPQHSGLTAGWCLISDVILRMPVSFLLKVVNITHKVDGLEEYLSDEKQYHLISQLPRKICNLLLYGRKYLFSIHEVATRLSYMGLVSFGPHAYKEKDQTFLFVHRNASIKNTTVSSPGYMKISDNIEYPVRKYYFESLQDVDAYWFEMESICLHTQLGSYNSSKGQSITIITPSRNPALIEASRNKEMHEVVDDGTIPGDGLGAGGLDSSSFAHLKRNWRWPSVHTRLSKTLKYKWQQKFLPDSNTDGMTYMKYLLDGSTVSDTSQITNCKKMRLGKLGRTSRLTLNEKEDDSVSVPVTMVPNIPKSKGQKRKINASERTPKKRKPDVIVRVVNRVLTRKRKPFYDEKDRQALKLMKKQRVDWSVQEDSFLLLCKVASCFLNPHIRGIVVQHSHLRDLLLENFPDVAQTKTSRACQRRLLFMLRNPTTVSNVSAFLGEAKQDVDLVQQFQGPKPPITKEDQWKNMFDSVLQHLLKKFTVTDSNDRSVKQSLPSTYDELERCWVISIAGDLHTSTALHPEPKNIVDIHCNTATSLLISSLCIQDSKTNWSFSLYKLYQQYPDSLLRSTVAKLMHDGIISRKKSVKRVVEPYVLLSSIPYRLPVKFDYSLSPRYQNTIYSEGCEFVRRLTSVHNNNSWVEMETDVSAGCCAAAISFLFTKKIEVEISVPDPIIIFTREKEQSNQEQGPGETETRCQLTNVGESEGSSNYGVETQTNLSNKGTRFALYLLRQQITDTIDEPVHHAQDYFLIDSCRVKCRVLCPPDLEDSIQSKNLAKEIVTTQTKYYENIGKAVSPDMLKEIFISLGYTDNDTKDGIFLYDYIKHGKELGATMSELMEIYSSKCHGLPLNQHLKVLKDAKAIIQGGVNVVRFISITYSDPWILKSIKVPKDKKIFASVAASKLPKRCRIESSAKQLKSSNLEVTGSTLHIANDVLHLLEDITNKLESGERTETVNNCASTEKHGAVDDRFDVQTLIGTMVKAVEEELHIGDDVKVFIEDLHLKIESSLQRDSCTIIKDTLNNVICTVVKNVQKNLDCRNKNENVIFLTMEEILKKVELLLSQKGEIMSIVQSDESELVSAVLSAVKSIINQIENVVSFSDDKVESIACVIRDAVQDLIDRVSAISVSTIENVDKQGISLCDKEQILCKPTEIAQEDGAIHQIVVEIIENVKRHIIDSESVQISSNVLSLVSNEEVVHSVINDLKELLGKYFENPVLVNDNESIKSIVESLVDRVKGYVLTSSSESVISTEEDEMAVAVLDVINTIKRQLQSIENLQAKEGTRCLPESEGNDEILHNQENIFELSGKNIDNLEVEPKAIMHSTAVQSHDKDSRSVVILLEKAQTNFQKSNSNVSDKISLIVQQLVDSLKNQLEAVEGKKEMTFFSESEAFSNKMDEAGIVACSVIESIQEHLETLHSVGNLTSASAVLVKTMETVSKTKKQGYFPISDKENSNIALEIITKLKQDLDTMEILANGQHEETGDILMFMAQDLIENLKKELEKIELRSKTDNFHQLDNFLLKSTDKKSCTTIVLEVIDSILRSVEALGESEQYLIIADDVSHRNVIIEVLECLKKELETVTSFANHDSKEEEDVTAVMNFLREGIEKSLSFGEEVITTEGIGHQSLLQKDKSENTFEQEVVDILENIKSKLEKPSNILGSSDILLQQGSSAEENAMEVDEHAAKDEATDVVDVVSSVVDSVVSARDVDTHQESLGSSDILLQQGLRAEENEENAMEVDKHAAKDETTGVVDVVSSVVYSVVSACDVDTHQENVESSDILLQQDSRAEENEENTMEVDKHAAKDETTGVVDVVSSVVDSVVSACDVDQENADKTSSITTSSSAVLEQEKVRTSSRRRKRSIEESREENINVFWEPANFVCRAWRKPDGTLNRPMLQKLMSALLGYIMTFPGIEESALCSKITAALQPVQILEILDFLIEAKCVQRYYLKSTKNGLFDNSSDFVVFKDFCLGTTVHYDAEPDAIVRFSELSNDLVLHH